MELKKGGYGRLPLRGGLSLLVTRNDRGFPGPGRERTGTIRRRSEIDARAAIITLTTTKRKMKRMGLRGLCRTCGGLQTARGAR